MRSQFVIGSRRQRADIKFNSAWSDAIRDPRSLLQGAKGYGQSQAQSQRLEVQRSKDERSDPEVEAKRDEVGDRKCDGTSGDFRVEF